MGKGTTSSGGLGGAPQWNQAAPGSPMIGGIPQRNTPVLDKYGVPVMTPEMTQQSLYVPPPAPASNRDWLTNYMLSQVNLGQGYGWPGSGGGANKSGGGYTTSGGGNYGGGSSAGVGMGGRGKW